MFSVSYEGDEYELYKNLNKSFDSPYSAYMNYPFGKILSFSPERFLSIKDNIVETKPIKGTRPRSDDPDVDKKNIQDLINIDGIAGRKAILKNAGFAQYFIAGLDFNLNIYEFF